VHRSGPECGPISGIRATTTAVDASRAAAQPMDSIEITVNGAPRRVAPGTTVADLITELGLADRKVAVERNRDVVPRARHGEVRLETGDRLELVTYVGGG
jgi:sulfur carrier protein